MSVNLTGPLLLPTEPPAPSNSVLQFSFFLRFYLPKGILHNCLFTPSVVLVFLSIRTLTSKLRSVSGTSCCPIHTDLKAAPDSQVLEVRNCVVKSLATILAVMLITH